MPLKFTNRVCMCGRPMESRIKRRCDFCDATYGIDDETTEAVDRYIGICEQPSQAERDEAQAINDAINKYVPLQSEEREPIRQPQPNRKWGRKG